MWTFGCLNFLTLFIVTQGYKGVIFPNYLYEKPQYSYNSPSSPFKELTKIYEARNIEFGFPSEYERQNALSTGLYIPDNALPIDTDVYYPPYGGSPKIFITIPRFGRGVPYSLGYLTNVRKPNGTEIQAYPHYNWHSSHGKDCNGLQSVYRTQIDQCGQMWILDSGEIDFVQYCPPQIVVIDLATNQLIHRYRLPPNMFKANISRFVSPIVDVADPPPNGDCKQAFVYMSDATGTGIVVYDVNANKSWRIENKYTYPDPDFGTHTIAGESFELLDGAFSFSLTPKNLGLRRMLYFHSLSNDVQVAVPLDVVNNETIWSQSRGVSTALDEFVPLGKRGVQCGAEAMTENGILLCGFLNPIALYGWNIHKPYTTENFELLAENPETLQFVSGLKVIKTPSGKEEVWLVSNRLQKFFAGTINYNEINFRIQKCGLHELLTGKNCI